MKKSLTILAVSTLLLPSCSWFMPNHLSSLEQSGYAFKPQTLKATPDQVVNHGF